MTEVIIIVCLLCFGGGGAGGFLVGRKTAVKTVNNITVIENTQTANSIAVAANIDVEDGGVHRYITFKVDGITNIEVLTITNDKTNTVDNAMPSWLSFPKIE